MNSRMAVYDSHGFVLAGMSESEAWGSCLFCGKESKFYINLSTGQYHCKYCAAKGNEITFLRGVVDLYAKITTKADYEELSKLRQLPVEAFRNWTMVYDGERWLIPYYGPNGKIVDIRIWNPEMKGIRSTKGCKTHLFGVDQLTDLPVGAEVFVCEGEWDAMALFWVMDQIVTEKPWAVVAVPGAGTFKDEWIDLFTGMDVVLAYDHDAPGVLGRDKAKKKLQGKARRVSLVEWPQTVNDGYDVRDFIIESLGRGQEPKEVLANLRSLVSSAFEVEEVTARGGVRVYKPGEEMKEEVTLKDVLKVFRKKIKMSSEMEDALRIVLALAFSIDIPGDPLWCYIVGPAGCGKTLLLMSFQANSRCFFQSKLSPKALVSGFKSKEDPSLLPKWNGKCVVLKDFTEILKISQLGREEIYSTLRGAYDGHVVNSWGNGVIREYRNLRFSMAAGVTPAVHGDNQAALGERFLKFEMLKTTNWSSDEQIRAAIDGIAHEAELEADLCDVVGRYLTRQIDRDDLPTIPEWVKVRIIALSQLIACLRAQVERELRDEERLRYRPTKEVGTRLAKQLIKLGQLLAFVEAKKEIDEDVYRLMERIAYDTANGFHLELVEALMKADASLSRDAIREATGIPRSNVTRALDDLLALGVVSRREDEAQSVGRPRLLWSPTPVIKDLWERSKMPSKTAKIAARQTVDKRTERPQGESATQGRKRSTAILRVLKPKSMA